MKKRTLILIIVLIMVVSIITILGVYRYIQKKVKDTEERLLKIANIVVNTEFQKESSLEIQDEVITKKELETNENVIGILKIPKLRIESPVKEGTSEDVLKYAVGHFSNSSFWNGNVSLAAHNRGLYTHYFEKINNLTHGDEIIYVTKFGNRTYKVTSIETIDSTDWSVTSNTEENIITLITCIKNQDKYRLCVRGEIL